MDRSLRLGLDGSLSLDRSLRLSLDLGRETARIRPRTPTRLNRETPGLRTMPTTLNLPGNLDLARNLNLTRNLGMTRNLNLTRNMGMSRSLNLTRDLGMTRNLGMGLDRETTRIRPRTPTRLNRETPGLRTMPTTLNLTRSLNLPRLARTNRNLTRLAGTNRNLPRLARTNRDLARHLGRAHALPGGTARGLARHGLDRRPERSLPGRRNAGRRLSGRRSGPADATALGATGRLTLLVRLTDPPAAPDGATAGGLPGPRDRARGTAGHRAGAAGNGWGAHALPPGHNRRRDRS